MEYPYNAIIGRGTLNAFEAILHPTYLCMKIPSEQGPIAVQGSQEAARRVEGATENFQDSIENQLLFNILNTRIINLTKESNCPIIEGTVYSYNKMCIRDSQISI